MGLAVSLAVMFRWDRLEEGTCRFSVRGASRPKPEGMAENETWWFQCAFCKVWRGEEKREALILPPRFEYLSEWMVALF